MSAPTPDLKPHVPPAPTGSEACGCCDGIVVETPQALDNRSGLSAIAYRIGEYPQFRASLHAQLSSSDFPRLTNLRTRDSDDFTTGLLDAFACVADVLTFYQERIANESYLRTAVERRSLQEMGKLIGYRLRPGVAAETWLAFALETPPTPPANLPPEPGSFVTGVPAKLKLDSGLKVQSVPGPDEKPQTFETVEALDEARPAWNALKPWTSETVRPGSGHTSAFFAGQRTGLKPGDALVFVGDQYIAGSSTTNWDFRIIDTVEPQAAMDRTLVRWKRPLAGLLPFSNPSSQHPQVHVLRKRAAIFGSNAPMWQTIPNVIRDQYPGGFTLVMTVKVYSPDWPGYTLSPEAPPASGGYVDLDAVYPEVHPAGTPDTAESQASYAVLAKGTFNFAGGSTPPGTHIELYKIVDVAEASRAEFLLSGKVSRLQLKGSNYAQFGNFVRGTSAFVQSEPLPLAPYPVDAPVLDDMVPIDTGADGLLPGRRLIVRGNRTSDGAPVVLQATLIAAHPVDASRCTLEISPPLPAPLRRDSVVVHANVVPASHGESVSQILGSGNAAQPFQRFEFKQLPLTYRAAGNELGAAAELTVRVGDVAWKERPTLFGAAASERAYALTTDEQGRDFVVFGDGTRGGRLPSGPNNIRATYRKGLGAAGNVASDTLTQLMSRPLGLKSVANPLAAEGGTDPESSDDARQTMPLGVRTLGRAVSVLDYEDFARAFTGIGKAQARVLQVGAVPTVVISLAGATGEVITSASPVWQNLLAALKASGDPHVPVQLLGYQASTFRLGIRVKCDPDYETKTVLAAVESSLRTAFAFQARALGQPVQQSEVIAVAQAARGVIAVDLTRLYGGTQPWFQLLPLTHVRLLASRMRVQAGVALPAELLTLDPAPLDKLEAMT